MTLAAGQAIVARAYADVLPGRFRSVRATVMLLAIGLQESDFLTREQRGGGPARSFWQFEEGGGIAGVLRFPVVTVRRYAEAVCAIRGVAPTPAAVYAATLTDDLIGCAFARLLLYTDPRPLPSIGDEAGAWDYYLRNWNPGKPRPDRWPERYQAAARAVQAEEV